MRARKKKRRRRLRKSRKVGREEGTELSDLCLRNTCLLMPTGRVLGSRPQEPSASSVHLAESSTEGVKSLGGYSFLSQEQHSVSFFL